ASDSADGSWPARRTVSCFGSTAEIPRSAAPAAFEPPATYTTPPSVNATAWPRARGRWPIVRTLPEAGSKLMTRSDCPVAVSPPAITTTDPAAARAAHTRPPGRVVEARRDVARHARGPPGQVDGDDRHGGGVRCVQAAGQIHLGRRGFGHLSLDGEREVEGCPVDPQHARVRRSRGRSPGGRLR